MMKKLFLFVLFVLFGTISAQTTFGVKGGYTLSNSKLEDLKFNSRSFFYIGGLIEHRLNDKFALQGELSYTQIGGNLNQDAVEIVGSELVSIGNYKTELLSNQIQLPISAKYYIVPNFNLSVGFNIGFNISSQYKNGIDYSSGFALLYNGDTDLFKSVCLFPFLGTEYQFKNRIFLDARYNFAAFNNGKQDGLETKIGFLQAGIGYRFK